MSKDTKQKKGDPTGDLEAMAQSATPLDVDPVVDSSNLTKQEKKDRKKQSAAVNELTGGDPRENYDSTKEQDAAQHMKKIAHAVAAFAAINTINQHHRFKKYKHVQKDVANLEKAYNAAKVSQGPRSVEQIMLEEKVEKYKKKLTKMEQKWPNLAKPMSLSQKFQGLFRTSKQGISEALRAQTMKGVAQANAGSDMRAIMAANAAGSVPTTGATTIDGPEM